MIRKIEIKIQVIIIIFFFKVFIIDVKSIIEKIKNNNLINDALSPVMITI